MCVRVILHMRFPKNPREDKNLRALAFALFGKPQNSSVRARSDFHTPSSDGAFGDFTGDTGDVCVAIETNPTLERNALCGPN